MKTYSGWVALLKPDQIFVFGSNTQGRHGAGSAKLAQSFGAKYGIAEGLQGQSYAIVTKDLTKNTHPSITKDRIIFQIRVLYSFARTCPDKEFVVAYRGFGYNLNGYSPQDMATMFVCEEVPDNIVFEEEFAKLAYTFS